MISHQSTKMLCLVHKNTPVLSFEQENHSWTNGKFMMNSHIVAISQIFTNLEVVTQNNINKYLNQWRQPVKNTFTTGTQHWDFFPGFVCTHLLAEPTFGQRVLTFVMNWRVLKHLNFLDILFLRSKATCFFNCHILSWNVHFNAHTHLYKGNSLNIWNVKFCIIKKKSQPCSKKTTVNFSI